MSLPIDIPRPVKSSGLSHDSLSSSPSSRTTTPTSVGRYIPVHKRAASASSSSPGRASSLTNRNRLDSAIHPHVYSAGFLLSLRPHADESMKDKLRTSCPEVVMSRRVRKGLEFHEQHFVESQRLQYHNDGGNHLRPAVTPSHASPQKGDRSSPAQSTKYTRTLRRNTKPAGPPAERRRQVLYSISVSSRPTSAENWRVNHDVYYSKVYQSNPNWDNSGQL